MKVAFRGNFQPDLPRDVEPWSTEHHFALSLEHLGHEVVRLQEDRIDWARTEKACRDTDLFLWVCTQSYADQWSLREARRTIQRLNERLPTVSAHLDLWFGLERARKVDGNPFFQTRHVFTADGGHDDEWEARGINHTWFPPAIFHGDCYPGTAREEFACDVAFVGNWSRDSYHRESVHRFEMLDQLRNRYGDRLRLWPQAGQPAVRGPALNDLYASAKVVVGDSCLAGSVPRYCSDRYFETPGRGGVLVAAHFDGVFPELLTPGVHVAPFAPFDWRDMFEKIDWLLEADVQRAHMRIEGQAHVLAKHTYAHRLQAVLDTVMARVA